MHHPELLQMGWEILNDAYRLDGLVLLHPPYMLALTALYIAAEFQAVDYRPFFKTLAVEQEKILAISAEFLAGWDEAEAYAAASTSGKILSLLQKLNEKGFKTLAQMHAATAATKHSSGAAAAAASVTAQQGKMMAPTGPSAPHSSAAASGHPAAPSLSAASHKRPAHSDLPPQQSQSQSQSQLPHLPHGYAAGGAGMAPPSGYSDRDAHKGSRN